MSKPHFVTLFPPLQDVHLMKDVAQIPWYMQEKQGYRSTLVGLENNSDWSLLNEHTPGIAYEALKDEGRKLYKERAVLNYLQREATNIDVLNLYHLTKESIAYGRLYKKLNPQGKLYLKMDVYRETLEKGIVYSRSFWKQAIHKRFEASFLERVDLVSCENPEALELLREVYPALRFKSMLIPNGVSDEQANALVPTRRNWSDKEHLILSVTRVGAPDKNTELLLDALAFVDDSNWRLALVGTIADGFKERLAEFIKSNPQWKDRITLTGAIYNRAELFDWYDRARIFALSSPFESFGIAFAEALWFGNYLVGTAGHSSFDLLTNNGQHGAQSKSMKIEEFARALNAAIARNKELDASMGERVRYAERHLSWSRITASLAERLAAS